MPTTTDHSTIRSWVEDRHGVPATVEPTAGGEEAGVLRIDFPDSSRDDALSTISWEMFFDKFEDANLAFVYQDETSDGEESRFCRFVNR